jgi:hypothetical protein
MTNLEKWEKFLKRKRWKYQEVDTKWGKSLMVKTYARNKRCHIFMSENKINYAFFVAGGPGGHATRQSTYCLSYRNGSLHMYNTYNKFFRNNGINGPTAIVSEMSDMFSSIKMGQQIIKFKTVRNKFKYITEYFLRLNKEKYNEYGIKQALTQACYPALKTIGPYQVLNRQTAALLRKKDTNIDVFIKKTMKHNSKIIRKALINGIGPGLFCILHVLKNRLNRGEVENLINSNSYWYDSNLNIKHLRLFFNQYTNKKIFKMLKTTRSYFELTDTLKQFYDNDKIVPPQDFKIFKDIHDNISIQYRKLQSKDYEFKVNKKLQKIDGTLIGSEIITVPKTKYELIEWGEKMNNCIGSYHSEVNSQRTIILGVKEGNEIKYNIEIRGGYISQFVKNRNMNADEKVINKYKEIFKEHKLIREVT